MLSRPAWVVSIWTMFCVPETASVPFSGTSRGATRTVSSVASPMPDGPAVFGREPERGAGHVADPLDSGVVEGEFSGVVRVVGRAERQHVREDHALERRVGTVHVEGGVGLRDAEILRLREDVVVVEPLGGHPGEDEVRRPVEHASNRGDVAGLDILDGRHRGNSAPTVASNRMSPALSATSARRSPNRSATGPLFASTAWRSRSKAVRTCEKPGSASPSVVGVASTSAS